MRHRLTLPVVVLGLVLSGCGGSAASTCDEVADEVIVLVQDLIDEVEQEAEAASIDDLLSLGEEALPSIERFTTASEEIDARAEALGCTQSELERLVGDRSDQLTSKTPIGRLIADAVGSGGL